MRIVKKPISLAEFYKNNFEAIKAFLSKTYDEFVPTNLLKKIKIRFGIWLGALILGIFLIALVYIIPGASSNDTAAMALYVSSVICFIVMGILIMLNVLSKRKALIKIQGSIKRETLFTDALKTIGYHLFRSSNLTGEKEIDKEKLQIAINGNNLLGNPVKNFINYTKGLGGIPSDAKIINRGELFSIVDEYNNPWYMMQVTFHWVRTTTDSKGNTVVHEYKKDVLALEGSYQNVHKDDNFAFSMGSRTLLNLSHKANITLENKKINKLFSIYSDDEIKIRKVFTPYSMEVLLEHYEQNKPNNLGSFGLTYKNNVFKAWAIPKGAILEVDAPKSFKKNKLIDSIARDILNDTYAIYWIISFINSTPVFY
ncbi:DUF3137 domain-containing protein [Mycoplasmopsis iners]|uniref:DUF3137 domain-containing protein n=1 Tax=Mycoplasmopsis iners TaxID=76630 RepID=UPI0004965F27|nr:DUF3137 domain-containing protein [Mycoplasmopsis iners]